MKNDNDSLEDEGGLGRRLSKSVKYRCLYK